MSAPEAPDRDGRRFVIVGGYGHVGRRLAELLAPRHSMVIAGRRGEEAARVAEVLDATAATVDASSGAGLEEVMQPGDVVLNASSDQPTAGLLRATLALGGDYADLSADPASIAAMRALDGDARTAGRRVLVGIGLSPGATNVMARAALLDRPEATQVDTLVILSVRDEFGPAAVEWTLRSFEPPDPAAGRSDDGVRVHPFRRHRRLDVPGIGPVLAHEFPFPEQRFLPDTLPVERSTSWCAFHPAGISRVIGVLGRRRALARMLSRPSVAARLARLARPLPAPRRPAVVGAAALATDATGATTMVSLASVRESETTARCATALLDVWPDGEEAHGVHLPESVIHPDRYFTRLTEVGLTVGTTSPPSQTSR